MTDDSNNPETEPAVAPGYPAVEVVLKIDVTEFEPAVSFSPASSGNAGMRGGENE